MCARAQDWLLSANSNASGAQIVFRSLIQPVFGRFFTEGGSTSAGLRSQADQATKPHIG